MNPRPNNGNVSSDSDVVSRQDALEARVKSLEEQLATMRADMERLTALAATPVIAAHKSAPSLTAAVQAAGGSPFATQPTSGFGVRAQDNPRAVKAPIPR